MALGDQSGRWTASPDRNDPSLFHRKDAREGQVLVVTKLGGPGQVCHVSYVDALLNPAANELARQVAEAVAPQFVCGQHLPGYYGVAPE